MKMIAVHRRGDAGDERVGLAMQTVARDAAPRGVAEQRADLVGETLGAIECHAQRIVVFAEIRILDELAVVGDRREPSEIDAEAKNQERGQGAQGDVDAVEPQWAPRLVARTRLELKPGWRPFDE